MSKSSEILRREKMETTVVDLIELFHATKQTESKAVKTLTWCRSMLLTYAAFLGEGARIRDLNINTARAFVAHLQAKKTRYEGHPISPTLKGGLSIHTIHGYVRTIKVFGTWLAEEEFVPSDPFAKLKRPKLPQTMIEVLTEAEIKKLLESINHNCFMGARLHTIVLVLLDTGIRADELLTLTVANTDLQSNQLKVMGKGKKERVVPFGITTKKALLRYITTWKPSGTNLVFTGMDGEGLTYTALAHLIKRLGEKNGVPRLRAHLLRHTFAVSYLTNGGDLMTLRLLLGHTTISTTQLYLHLAGKHLEVSHSKFSPVDRLNVKSRTKG